MTSLSPTSAQPTMSKEKAQSLKDVEKLPTLTTLCDVDQCDPDASNALTPAIKWKRRIQFVTLCSCLFVEGWNDGSTGPLLPRIQDRYHVRPQLRQIFASLTIGYISPRSTLPWSHYYSFSCVLYAFHPFDYLRRVSYSVFIGVYMWCIA